MRAEILTALRTIDGLAWTESEPMSRYTTFRIGGPAAVMAFPTNCEQLQQLLQICSQTGEAPVVIGNGSNVLAPDAGLDRIVICLKNLQGISVTGNTVTCHAGVTMAKLANEALAYGLTGLEFAHGIPGTIGGGVVMNAGAYGGELKDVVTKVVCFDLQGNELVREGEALDFGYRHSCFDDGAFVVASVTMELQHGDPHEIRSRMDELAAKRRASQPLEYPSAGSTFKRPTGHFAAALIQACGLKGLSVGGAQVSEKHAGFVINQGGATCTDVLMLTSEVKRIVLEQTGVSLELEVKLL